MLRCRNLLLAKVSATILKLGPLPGHPVRRCRCRGRSSALAPLQYRLRQLGIWRRRDGRGADLCHAKERKQPGMLSRPYLNITTPC